MSIYTRVLKSKIHRATVTHADLAYEGSITLPQELMEAAYLQEYEAVSIWDVTNGARIETYTMRGKEGSSDIAINGAAAHLVKPRDLIIIASFISLSEELLVSHKPHLIFVDEANQIKEKRAEIAGPELTNG